ncbi:Crotonobetainyl-CoA:carnitine CoA-transferase CaiB [Pseudonocardia thermophila]|jgi:Predicted acyl-CoA transferases/carnitine dehydratase|uniref:Crotonobetainyl-CoA:carnitine CoA-transferase CaiB n=1 Tax=Pseudonocardia thermophila TaxID=1848 RepID=A0A1M6XZ57_PSETH|nr:CoA transferase [Pseudonocardia thermophila]SHL11108.1 Crotonobetainyl-CoA:carnitine CoA-transferase CaiB [Pseudonocardia thermophila]
MPLPLEGIRVLDLGHHVAGPLAATMLADQGAEVVRIDRPGAGSPPTDAFYQRGKRRITLDLTDPDDRQVARGLALRSDVVVENFRPGALDRFGLGYEQLHDVAPGLVYLSLPGFAPDDPRAGVRAWEGVVDAATGNCRVRAGEEPEGHDPDRPTYSAVPIASNFAAFLGVVGTVAALIERRRSGRGQHVSVPLFDAMFEAIGAAGAYVTAHGLPPAPPLRANGSGTYRCADGAYAQFNPIGATRRFVTWFLHEAGHPELAVGADEDELRARLTELFASRPAAEWEEIGHAAGVPLCRIRTSQEWLRTPHARESGAVVRLADPELGETLVPGPAVRFGPPGASGPDVRPRRLPDADRDELLAEVAGPPPAPSVPANGGTRHLPLAGVRVLDLTQILAGPSSGRILGELGAHVTKINAPQRRIAAHGVVNRGKETVLLDVTTDEGKEVFWKLVDEADVIVQNFPPGVADRYGIGYGAVRARRPQIVHVSVSCYGGEGPWARGRGYETQAQAVTGVMARAGGTGKPAVLGPYNLLDYGTGVLAAYAAVLGLHHRAATGEGLELRTSLVQTASHHQGLFMVDFAGARHGGEPAGPYALGEADHQRFHRAADRWLYVHAQSPEELAAALGADGGDVAAVIAGRSARDVVEELVAAGIGAHEVVELDELMVDPQVRRRGLSVTQVSEEVGEVTMPGLAITMSATPPRLGAPVRQPGADAIQVLDRIGLADAVPELERRWVLQTTHLPAGWRT